MNNKKIGTQFEREMVAILAAEGWWAHFIQPNAAGSQPFDVIAVKGGKSIAIDCKTSVSHIFPISRLEENQILAFNKWIACGNGEPFVAVKYNEEVYMIGYCRLAKEQKVDLNKCEDRRYEEWKTRMEFG